MLVTEDNKLMLGGLARRHRAVRYKSAHLTSNHTSGFPLPSLAERFEFVQYNFNGSIHLLAAGIVAKKIPEWSDLRNEDLQRSPNWTGGDSLRPPKKIKI